eukprot:gene5551-6913_t
MLKSTVIQKILESRDTYLEIGGMLSYLASKTYYFGVGGGVRRFEELVQKEKRLKSLKFKTVSYDPSDLENPINYTEFIRYHQYLQTSFPLVHSQLTRTVVNSYSLLYKWTGAQPSLKPILINAHFDVVPITPFGWEYDPFNGTIANGYIYGRGALDNKLIVMSSLEAVETLLFHGYQPRRTIYFAFGHDEEIGGDNGHKKISQLLQSQGITAEMVLDEGLPIMAPGFVPGLNKTTANIGVFEKGYLYYTLTVNSSGGHSAMPPAESAIGILSKAIIKLEANPFPVRMDSYSKNQLLSLFTPTQINNTPFLQSMTRTTTAVTMTRAGTKPNVIANQAIAWVNHRIVPGENSTYVLNRVLSIINDTRVQVNIDAALQPSPYSDPAAPAFGLVKKSLKKIFGNNINVVGGLMFANTDTRHYWNVSPNLYRIIPAINTAADFGTIHGYNERISIDSYLNAIKFYKKLILQFNICNNLFSGGNNNDNENYNPTGDPDLSDCDC